MSNHLRVPFALSVAPVFALALLAVSAPGNAQDAGACTIDDIEEPPLTVYHCAGGLLIEAEAMAAFGFVPAPDPQAAGAVSLGGGAARIELAPGQGGFQILTPHAIASVRGTVWIVDAAVEATSVFVVAGEVSVSRADGTDPVLLGAGDGVSVAPGAPLSVQQWPPDKVVALLSRFGR